MDAERQIDFMNKQFSLKISRIESVPFPIRLLIKPMVFLAIGLHALVLFFPLSGQQSKPKLEKKDEAVKLTQLSKAQPQLRPKVQRNLPKAKVDRPKPPIAAPSKPATPAENAAAQTNDVLANFPHYPNAQPNCYGKTGDICRFTNDSFSAVVAHFEKSLPANKYKLEVDTDNSGEKIYRVIKAGQPFYLSILADPPLTVYFVTADRINKAKLGKIKTGPVAQIPAELQGLLDAVAPPTGGSATLDPTPLDLGANAAAFFQSDPANPSNQTYVMGIYSARIAEAQGEAEIVAEAKTKFDRVTPTGTYGGGNLYELKKGSFTGYLSVVKGTTGTIVVIWTDKPQ
ncbi:MAG: hypothetical protein WCA35_25855 [Kovacikia sp.]